MVVVELLDQGESVISFSSRPQQHVIFHEIDHLGRNMVGARQSVADFLMHVADFGPRIYPVMEATGITTAIEGIVLLHSLFAARKIPVNAIVAETHPGNDLGCDGTEREDIGGKIDAIGSGL
jgi:hypothetical protein